MTVIAEFFATLGFKVDQKEVAKVDKFLNSTEKSMKGQAKAGKLSVTAQKEVVKTTNQMVKSQESLRRAEGKRFLQTERMQKRINRLFPSMGRGPLAARSPDRKIITSMYGGMFNQAAAGRIGVRNPVAAEAKALQRLGMNSPAFAPMGARLQAFRQQKMLGAETGALGRLGENNPRFKPTGSAFRMYDERLSAAVTRGRASAATRVAQATKADPSVSRKSTGNREVEVERRKLALLQRGEETEKRILEMRRRAAVIQERTSRRMGAMGAGGQRVMSAVNIGGSSGSTFLASGGRSGASYGRANYLHAGGAAGAIMRYGVDSLPFIGGAMGLSALNRANQEVRSAELTTQAVTEAAGLYGQGPQAYEWLRSLASEVGMNYMDSAQDYNSFLSNALGAGVSLGGSQDVFQGMVEYSTAMGITPYRRKLVLNALSQMFGKGQVQAEELNFRLAA